MSVNLGAPKKQHQQKPGEYNKEDKKPHDSVAAIITKYDKNNNVQYLVMWHKKIDGLTFPVGKVKPDQTVTEALIAENKEELAINIETYMEILQFHKEYDMNGKMVPVNTHIFKVIKFTGTPKNNEPQKHAYIKWMTREELEKAQKKLGDCVTRYFAWLDDINTPSLLKPHVAVGNGK